MPVQQRKIMKAAESVFMTPLSILLSSSRKRDVVHYRFATAYVLRFLNDTSYPMLGRIFGERDHSTMMNAVYVAENNPYVGELVEELLEELEGDNG